MRYSEIVDVQKYFNDAFDVISDNGESWKTFISNERFEHNLTQILNSFTSPVFNNRKSIWIQGTYGTGKSHSLAVIKHLLSDDYNKIEDYIPRINRSQLRNSISTFRQNKRVFPVVLKGTYLIADVVDFAYTIQQQVAEALGDIEISTKTDFQSVLQILENGQLDSFFENLLKNNQELYSYATNKEQLVVALHNGEKRVIRIIANELKRAGLGGVRTHNIVEWLAEVKAELQAKGIADYLLLIWDEFTTLLDIQERRSILNLMQDIAELSYREVNSNTDTQGVYVLMVTHKRLEATESYKDLKEDERNMAKARFVELDYGMQPTTTFHILSEALDRKRPEILKKMIQENFIDVPSVRMLVDKVVDADATNAAEVKGKIISLYPFHPYTSYLATFVSRVVGEAERSIFGFLNDEEYGFKKFIQVDTEDKKFLTADYVWDFFYKTFEQNTAGYFDVITNKFKLLGETVREHGEKDYAVFKTILLLNILYRVTTMDSDVSEKSMVIPSVENIIAAFSGVFSENEVMGILDYIDENQIMHKNPDGVFEAASSVLPQKKILEEKKKLYASKEDVSKIVEEYTISCKGKLEKNISRDISRELDVQVFWGGDKEYLLRNKIVAKFKNKYTANVAIILHRGVTKELDSILGRAESDQMASRSMLIRFSKEPDFKNNIFVLVNTELGNRRFEAYLDSLAQEAVARSLQMNEERDTGQKNAEKWILQWIEEIISSGLVDIIFRGDVVHVPYIQCNKYLRDNYITTIFKYGLDGLPVPNTAWKHQNSKKAVELVLYSLSKGDLEANAKNTDAAVKYLLNDGNTVLFNDRLELISTDSNVPVVKVCQAVKAVFDKNKKEVSINLAKELEFLSEPEYGYYQNRPCMGALALALRPYVDKLYKSGNGQRIDKTVMKDVVVDIFDFWENEKFSDKFVVRMSTEEERALTDKLKTIFDLPDKDGLLDTKWGIREKFEKQSKAPLWALKYVGENSSEYNEFIDKMFRFSKSTDDNIQHNFILDLFEGVKTYDVELSSAVKRVENNQCLDEYISIELVNLGEHCEDLKAVHDYLAEHMSSDIVFWEEDDVRENILRWKIQKDSAAEELAHETAHHEDDDEANAQNNLESGQTSDHEDIQGDAELKSKVLEKLEKNRTNSEKLYEILKALASKYANILNEINKMM